MDRLGDTLNLGSFETDTVLALSETASNSNRSRGFPNFENLIHPNSCKLIDQCILVLIVIYWISTKYVNPKFHFSRILVPNCDPVGILPNFLPH